MQTRLLSIVAVSVVSVLALTGCNALSSPANPQPTPVPKQQSNVKSIISSPNPLDAITSPNAQGDIVVLAGTAASRGLYTMSLSDGSISVSQSVSNHATTVAETNDGTLAIAQSTSASGAVQLVNSSTLKVTQTIPVGGPVRSLVAGASPNLFYALNGGGKSEGVAVIDARQGVVTQNIPVSLGTIAIATDGQTLYGLQVNGDIEAISLSSKKVQYQFHAVKNPIAFTLSPDGQSFYVLKRAGNTENVSVINMATESQTKVLAAPRGANSLGVNASGTLLYVGVSTGKSSNVQALKVQ